MFRLLTAALFLIGASSVTAQDTGILGAWRLNPELGSPAAPPRQDDGRPPGGRGAGRPGGGGGFGGGFGGGGRGGPMPGAGRGPSEDDLRRMRVIGRRLADAPRSLVIVRDGERVTLTDGDGRSTTLTAHGKKEERLTGDGEFTSKTRFEGAALVVEEDFGGGVKLTTRYAPVVSEERERLEVTLQASGLRPTPSRRDGSQGPMDGVTRIYEREPRR